MQYARAHELLRPTADTILRRADVIGTNQLVERQHATMRVTPLSASAAAGDVAAGPAGLAAAVGSLFVMMRTLGPLVIPPRPSRPPSPLSPRECASSRNSPTCVAMRRPMPMQPRPPGTAYGGLLSAFRSHRRARRGSRRREAEGLLNRADAIRQRAATGHADHLIGLLHALARGRRSRCQTRLRTLRCAPHPRPPLPRPLLSLQRRGRGRPHRRRS